MPEAAQHGIAADECRRSLASSLPLALAAERRYVGRTVDLMAPSPMYSAGDCAVCASGGAAIFVKDVESGRVFLSYPECGCAWLESPKPFVVDTVYAPIDFAPNGFCLATPNDIVAAGMADSIKSEATEASSGFVGSRGFRAG